MAPGAMAAALVRDASAQDTATIANTALALTVAQTAIAGTAIAGTAVSGTAVSATAVPEKAAVTGVVAVTGAVAAPTGEAASGAETRLRILVAEDNPTNRLVALRLLERLGHNADAVGTGTEAIEALDLVHYDLVLMDVMMPDMDGMTATRQIRATERPAKRIAIVGLTAGSGSDTLAACKAAGMDAVTTKPVTLARLRAVIAEGCTASSQHPAAGGQMSTTPRLLQLTETLGEDAVAEIITAFAEDTQAQLATMRTAAAREDGNTIFRSAHSVSGAARNVGADALAERALALEAMAGSLSGAQITNEIAAMQHELDAVLEVLMPARSEA